MPCTNPQINFARNEAQTLVEFGDSMTSNGWITSGTYTTDTTQGIFERYNIKARQPFTVLNNAGVSDNTTTQMLARLATDVLAFKPGWVSILTGTNDYGAGISVATTIANITSMIQQIRATGANVIIGTMPPRSSSITQAMLANMLQINNWTKDYAAKTPGVYPVDYFSYMLDTSSLSNAAQGLPASGVLLADGLHPSGYGAGIMGEVALYDALNGLVKPMSRRAMANRDGTGNGDLSYLNRNPLMLQGTGGTAGTGVTGIVAQYYSIQRYAGSGIGATASIIARSAGSGFFATDGFPGYLQKIDFSGAAATTDELTMTFAASPAPAAGDGPYVAEMEFFTTMASGTLLNQSLTCIFGGSGYVVYSNYSNAAPLNITGTFQGLLRSRSFTIPAGATSMTGILSIKTSAGATGNIQIGYAGVRKLQV